MFPLRWNFPFRKKDGSITTIDDAISEGGGGGGYTLPTASADTKGGIKIGSGLSMSGEVLNNTNPTAYTLPTASAETLGGVKIGSGLSISEGVLNNSNPTPYSLPTASSDTLGGVKIGSGITIDENGAISASGGGSSKYLHHFCIGNYLSGTYLAFNVVLDTPNKFDLTNSPTYTKLTAFLLAHGYSVNDSFPASGIYRASETINIIVSVMINATSLSATYPNGSTLLSSAAISTSDCYETVIAL